MNVRPTILLATDRVLAAVVVALVLGSAVCFGGAVWWFRPAVAVLCFLLAGIKLAQLLYQGRMPFLKSPLTLLGLLALALGILQLVPLPPPLARRLSPVAQQIYSYGVITRLAQTDLPAAGLGEPAFARSPATLDRAATLRWLVGAAVCLGIFWSVSHFADRLGRLYLVWGSVVAAFLLQAALALVQITGGAEGLYGFLRAGQAPPWAPSLDDLLETPSTMVMRPLEHSSPVTRSAPALQPMAVVAEQPFWFGTMVGSAGAFLAFGSLALPLALAIVLQLISPRGSREGLTSRMSHTGQGGLVLLLMIMLVVSAFLVGLMAGPRFCLPFILGLAVAALPGAAGSRWLSIGLLALLVASLGLGAILVAAWPNVVGGPPPVAPVSWESTRLLWKESVSILREFPIVGTGFGSFGTIHPYMKTRDAASTTAMSSLLQCGVESGAIGLLLLSLAGLWCVCRLPVCLKRVGSADRTLAYGLIGAAVGFSLWFVVQWTVELPAVAISASALGGTWNRWLAGGTDLFVERG
ncbi:MAG: O-antigen ligase domain-containing protein [Isosphaerales bacterium]